MSPAEELRAAMARCPLIAILRGVRVQDIESIGETLISAGFAMIEVPMNSPDPLTSIARLVQCFGGDALIGAGTVLSTKDVVEVRESGARMIISPNTNPDVITATTDTGMISLPGYFTPSEAFAAISAGATGLKLFPAEAASATILRAQRAVLPKRMPIFAVGGITPDSMRGWTDACDGFGLGSALYSPAISTKELAVRARAFFQMWSQLNEAEK